MSAATATSLGSGRGASGPGVEFADWQHESAIRYIWKRTGHALPKAAFWAIVASATAAVLIHMKQDVDIQSEADQGNGFLAVTTFVAFLGFMVTVRGSQAWNRYYEAADLVKQARGEWLAVSTSVFAQCCRKHKLVNEVDHFKALFATLMSLLMTVSMRKLSGRSTFVALQLEGGLDPDSLSYLSLQENAEVQMEVVLGWIERAVVDSMSVGVLPMSTSLLSRTFDKLSSGLVRITSATKVGELQFPVLYATLFYCMLIICTALVPIMSAYLMETVAFGATSSFVIIFFLWCLNYLAEEVETPYSNLPNSIPLEAEVQHMNQTLSAMMSGGAARVPRLPAFKNTSQKKIDRLSISEQKTFLNREAHDLTEEADDYGLLFASALGGAAEAAAALCFGGVVAAAEQMQDTEMNEHDDFGLLFLPGVPLSNPAVGDKLGRRSTVPMAPRISLAQTEGLRIAARAPLTFGNSAYGPGLAEPGWEPTPNAAAHSSMPALAQDPAARKRSSVAAPPIPPPPSAWHGDDGAMQQGNPPHPILQPAAGRFER